MDVHRSLLLFPSMPARTSASQGRGAGTCAPPGGGPWSQDSRHPAMPPPAELCQTTEPQVVRAQDLSKPGCGSLKTKPQLSLPAVQECLAPELHCQSQGQSDCRDGEGQCQGDLPWGTEFISVPVAAALPPDTVTCLQGPGSPWKEISRVSRMPLLWGMPREPGTCPVTQSHLQLCLHPPWHWGLAAQPGHSWECRDFAAFRVQSLDTADCV